MTDREKQYLIAEIERLKDCASPIVVCDTLLSLIDSMQENPCDGCTNRKGCITCENGELRETELSHSEVIKISDQAEPVSEQLESWDKFSHIDDAIEDYCRYDSHIVFFTESLNGEPLEEADDREQVESAFKAGAQWQKEQMMAKAVDGEIGYWNIRGLSVNMDLHRTLEEGDKVKVIIIKEENV